ncbi:MAG: sulfur carrier protein ThiS [Nitrospirota bacterium]|nr:sulfur carrier protein ThiS [Nitrospirota bacterium]
MKIVVNGKPREAADGLTVAALIAELGITAPRVAVERNMDIVDRERFADTVLAENDQVEIIHFVGGGA